MPDPIKKPDCIPHLNHDFDSERAKALPPHTQYNFHLKLTKDLIKIHIPMYSLSVNKQGALKAWLLDLLDKDYIYQLPPQCPHPNFLC